MFSLSNSSESILEKVDDRLTIKVYFSDNLPNELGNTRRYLQDILEEYINKLLRRNDGFLAKAVNRESEKLVNDFQELFNTDKKSFCYKLTKENSQCNKLMKENSYKF